MGEYFRGWKRKVGCVTLLMACALMLGWVLGLISETWLDKLFANNTQYVQYRLALTPEGFQFHKHQGYTPANGKPVDRDPVVIIIPLAPFAIPLTLLSAWLLLSKPRSKPAATQSVVARTN